MKGRYGLLVILAVYGLVRAFWLLADDGGRLLGTALAQAVLTSALWSPSCALILKLAHRMSPQPVTRELGLERGFVTGLGFAVITTLPMAFAMLPGGLEPGHISVLAAGSVIDPVAETILFSGFLSGQLLHRARWPLPAAVAISALLFGLAHIEGFVVRWQSWWPALTAIAAAGAVFTWIALRWGSLWPAIALHGAINMWWTLSGEASDTSRFFSREVTPMAAGHAMAMALAVIVTLRWTRRPRLAPAYFTRTV